MVPDFTKIGTMLTVREVLAYTGNVAVPDVHSPAKNILNITKIVVAIIMLVLSPRVHNNSRSLVSF